MDKALIYTRFVTDSLLHGNGAFLPKHGILQNHIGWIEQLQMTLHFQKIVLHLPLDSKDFRLFLKLCV